MNWIAVLWTVASCASAQVAPACDPATGLWQTRTWETERECRMSLGSWAKTWKLMTGREPTVWCMPEDEKK